MSKCSRPLTLILAIILSFSIFSVNAFASNEENLVSSDLRTWNMGSNLDDGLIDPDAIHYIETYNYSRLRIRYPQVDGVYVGGSVIYELPSIEVGENYQFSFKIPTLDIIQKSFPHITDYPSYFGENVTCVLGIGFLDYTGELNHYDEFEVIIDSDNINDFVGREYVQHFRLENVKGSPVFAISFLSVGSPETIVFFQDLSLTKVESESDKKLDGILGWLQELWNSITGGFDRIQTKLTEVITNLSSALTDVWQRITSKLEQIKDNLVGEIQSSWQNINTKLGEVITGLTGELRMLGDRIVNYLLYLGPEVPENPFKTEESPLTKVQGYIDDVVNYINDFTEDMDDVIDSLSAGIKIFTEFVEDNKWVMILVAVSLFLLVVGRFVGI